MAKNQTPNTAAAAAARLQRITQLGALAAAAGMLGACASLAAPDSTPAAGSAGAAAAPSAVASASAAASAPRPAASAAAAPGAPRPFSEVIKDAKVTKALFPMWRKDDKIWLELAESDFNVPFMFGANITQSLGESGLYASQMGRQWRVEWRKVGTNVQLIALNDNFRNTRGDKGLTQTLKESFSESLIASAAIGSAPNPGNKAILIDAGFLLADLPNYGYSIEGAFRIPYSVDRGNSAFTQATGTERNAAVGVKLHFTTPRVPLPPTTPLPPGVPVPRTPTTTPDARSFFVGYMYNFTALPKAAMAARAPDPRLGHFTTAFTDLSQERTTNNRVHMVNRWRLEKKDPSAAMSEPVEPIVFWMDKNIPARYRKAVEEGIVLWNQAFEGIGFKNAVQAKQQDDSATWDSMDSVHASIRWFTGADVGFAIGPSRTDPRSGEILDADIGMSDVFARGARRVVSELVPRASALTSEAEAASAPSMERMRQLMSARAQAQAHSHGDHAPGQCHYAAEAAEQMHFALDVLEARGDLDPDSPQAEAFVNDVIRDTIAHEVGHTLGLKHNFKASTAIKAADLKKPGTQLATSVMDYNPYNIPLRGEPTGDLNMKGLGVYDKWAIEYAYSAIATEQEASALAGIAGKSNTNPMLVYADDADAGFGSDGLDPLANRFDMGDDPLAYYKRRVKLSQELFETVQSRVSKPGDDPLRARRNIGTGFGQVSLVVDLLGKYVGGMSIQRDVPGPAARRAYVPVDPAKQREALQFVTDTVFRADSFKFRPEFLTAQGPDFSEWNRDTPLNVPARVLQIQTNALDRLLSGGVASRLLDLPAYVPGEQRKNIISLNEVYNTVGAAVWQELRTGADPDRLRRALQREHLRRLTSVLTKPAPLPADAVALMRQQARGLLTQLQGARSGAWSVESKAHLADSVNLLSEALKASFTRT